MLEAVAVLETMMLSNKTNKIIYRQNKIMINLIGKKEMFILTWFRMDRKRWKRKLENYIKNDWY